MNRRSFRTRFARVRLALAGAGVLMLAGLGVLLTKAIAAGEREQDLREQAVIARVFDELEGTLAAFVATEQARPFVQWRPGDDAQQLSPLARVQPQRPWLVGYFQIEPDGQFGSPLIPVEGESALPIELRERVALLREYGSEPARLALADPVPQQRRQPQQQSKQQTALPEDLMLQRALDQQSTTRLNSLVNDNAIANPAPDYAQISSFLGNTDRPEPIATPDMLDIRVEPFVASEVGERWLKLRREVWIGERRWTQGLLLDRPALERWLEAQVLGSPELAAAITLDWQPHADAEHRHDFSEPFAMLHVDAVLRTTIGETEGQRLVVVLGLLLALALITVLVAVDRTLATLVARAEERERFIAAVTHELRTPLTSIRMYSEMLEQGMVGDPVRQTGYHRTIRTEAERLSRLVEQVLTLARLDQASDAARIDEPAPLAEIVAGVVELLQPQADQRELTLDVQLDPASAALNLPRDTLTQVLTNLLDNAIKFSVAGDRLDGSVAGDRLDGSVAGDRLDGSVARGDEIELQATRVGNRVRVVVRDRGPGVEPELLDRMFEPFVRGRAAEESATPGTGIGLALVRSLVGELGGRISARARDGGGLELVLELPIVEPTASRR